MFPVYVQAPVMIQRLHELQTDQDPHSHLSSQDLPQDSQVKAAQNSSTSTDQQDVGEKKEEEGKERGVVSKPGTKPLSQKNGASSSGSSSTRLLPRAVYQASIDPSSRETEERRAGGGGRPELKENGRKVKQKAEEHVEKNDSSDQAARSAPWSEVSSVLIGSEYCLSPLSPAMEQRLLLQYLTALGDYQEVRAAQQE